MQCGFWYLFSAVRHLSHRFVRGQCKNNKLDELGTDPHFLPNDSSRFASNLRDCEFQKITARCLQVAFVMKDGFTQFQVAKTKPVGHLIFTSILSILRKLH